MAVPLEIRATVPAQLREDVELNLLLEGVFQLYGSDFRWHARTDLAQRIRKFIERHELESVFDLLGRIMQDRFCGQALCRTLLESDSNLLEKPGELSLLREAMDTNLSSYPLPRIWIAECTATEEIFVFAMLLAEAGLLERSSIYVTCSNEDILHDLQSASFSTSKLTQLESIWQQCGFGKCPREHVCFRNNEAVFSDALRSRLVWAHYNLATDRSFNEFQLISCRSSLFRLAHPMRRRVISLFRESLASYGVMHFGEVANDADCNYLKSFNLQDHNRVLWKHR